MIRRAQLAGLALMLPLLTSAVGLPPTPTPVPVVQTGPAAAAPPTLIDVTRLAFTNNDILYDPGRNVLYISTPPTAGQYANSIVPMTLPDRTLGTPIPMGSNPRHMALSDDGQFLYIGIDGGIRRLNLVTQSIDQEITFGPSYSCGARVVEDLVVLRNDPNVVVAAVGDHGYCDVHLGVFVYEGAVMRPDFVPASAKTSDLERSHTDTLLFGASQFENNIALTTLVITETGISVSAVLTDQVSYHPTRLRYADGLLYRTGLGTVINSETLATVGRYLNLFGSFDVDGSANRVVSVNGDWMFPATVRIFNKATYQHIGDYVLPDVREPSSLIKVGENLYAFRERDAISFMKVTSLDKTIYIPVIANPCRYGICGRVTENGAPAANVYLELRFFDGAAWSTRAYTLTDAQGQYALHNIPTLLPGQRYYVRYRNTALTHGRLWSWATRVLTAYTINQGVAIGNFDIADVTLQAPWHNAQINLPYTFQWSRRPAHLYDSYELDLYDPQDGVPYAYTNPPLGYVGNFTLTQLPPGFELHAPYVWDIWIHSPDGGVGVSLYAPTVTFLSSGLSITSVAPTPLRLRPELDEEFARRQQTAPSTDAEVGGP